ARGVLLEVQVKELADSVLRLHVVPAESLRAIDELDVLRLAHARHRAQALQLVLQAVLPLDAADEDAVLLAVVVRFGAHQSSFTIVSRRARPARASRAGPPPGRSRSGCPSARRRRALRCAPRTRASRRATPRPGRARPTPGYRRDAAATACARSSRRAGRAGTTRGTGFPDAATRRRSCGRAPPAFARRSCSSPRRGNGTACPASSRGRRPCRPPSRRSRPCRFRIPSYPQTERR